VPATLRFVSYSDQRSSVLNYITFKLQKLCSDLAPLLQSLRQPSYYSAPRFHTSIAWALLDRVRKPSEGKPTAAVSLPTRITDTNLTIMTPAESQIPAQFTGIPGEVIRKLNSAFRDRLSSPSIGCFDAESISLKIGKDVVSWPFIGVWLSNIYQDIHKSKRTDLKSYKLRGMRSKGGKDEKRLSRLGIHR